MLDVLDLYVPSLVAMAPFAWVARETAWGPADEATLCSGDLAFARRLPSGVRPVAALAVTAMPASLEGLTLAHEARTAMANEAHWQRYLILLRGFLDYHVALVLVAEADCGQYPIVQVELSTADVVARLNEQRQSPKSSFSLCAVARRN
jgi:hypothetical protein